MQVGTGFSAAASARDAGAEAMAQALRSVETPKLVFLFWAGGYDPGEIFEGASARAGNARVVGACGGGVLTAGGLFRQGVAVLVLGGAELSVATAMERMDERDPEATGRRLAQGLLTAERVREGTVFVFFDGWTGRVDQVLCGLHEVLGPSFRYAGGGTGDNLKTVPSYQVTERGVACGAVAAALVAGRPCGVGVAHGWSSIGDPLVITKARGRLLYDLDGQPGLQVYAQRVDGLDRAGFALRGAAHPLGLVDASGRFVLRDPVGVRANGAIEMMADVPPRAVAFMMTAGKDDMLMATREAVTRAMRGVARPEFAIVCDCVSRFLFLGEGAGETALLRYALGAVPFVGFLSCGEVAAYEDVPLVHNKTLVVACGGA